MGHGSGNCHHDPKCLKCGEGHLTKECTKPRDTPAKCANCKGPQPVNSTTCEYYKRHLAKVMDNRTKNTTNAAIARTTIELTKTQFLPLLKSNTIHTNNTAQHRTNFGQGGQEEKKPSDPHPIQSNYGFNRQLASTARKQQIHTSEDHLTQSPYFPHSKRISLGRTQDILTGCSDIPQ